MARAASRRTRLLPAFEGLLLAVVIVACGQRQGRIEGRAVARGAGVAGATVDVYLGGERGAATPPFATTAAGADGSFRLELPPGSYWVWVKDLGAGAGPRRIAEYPGNPVAVAAGGRAELGEVELREVGGAAEVAVAGSGVRGRALAGGEPVPDAVVMVYPGDRERLAGPGYLALVRTGPDGGFEADLVPGTYRLAVRRRLGGETAGFLGPGDLSGAPAEDPVVVEAGSYRDLGAIELHPVDPGRLEAEAARGFQGETGTAIEGHVVDREGKPRPGIFVFVYRDEGMIGRPDAVAAAGEDGAFSLALPGGGRYHVGARSRYGGPRQPGEAVGRLAGVEAGAIEVPEGRRVKGLTIVAEETW